MRALLAVSLSALGIAMAAPAWAQEVPVPAEASAGGSGEIVVTANKRAQNIQDVPAAVTAVSPERLAQANITSAAELPTIAPSLQFVPSPNPNSSQFVVRGVGTFAFADTLEQSVGVAVDGVPLGRIVGSVVDAVDVQRVEVLRGPQGTLFGKSATAGLISVVTNKPTFATSVDGRVYLGEFNERRFSATANLPIVPDKVALRATGWAFRRDGYVDAPNQPTGAIGGFNNKGARLRAAVLPTEGWRIDLTGEYSKNRNGGSAFTYRAYYPADTLVANRNLSQGIVAGRGNLRTASELPNGGFVTSKVAQLESNLDVGATNTLTLLSSYRDVRGAQGTDFDYTDSAPPVLRTDQQYRSHTKQFTTELRLANNTGSRLQYTLGLFYYHLDLRSTLAQVILRNPAAPFPIGRQIDTDLTTRSYAGFADLTYNFGRFRLIAGGRVSHDSSDGTYDRRLPAVLAPGTSPAEYAVSLTIPAFGPFAAASSISYTDFSYRAGAQYDLARDVMLYAIASKAYKGPGFNFASDLSPAVFALNQAKIRSETGRNYEVGLRSQLFDRTVTVNLTGYYSPFSNFQINAAAPTNPISYTIINARKLVAKGVELEFGWRPRGRLQGFTLDGSATYNDSQYKDFRNAPCYVAQAVAAAPTTQSGVCAPISAGNAATVQSVNGLRLIGAPEWTANVFAGYDTPVTDRLGAFVQARFNYTSAIQYGVGANPATVAAGYHTVGVNFGIHDADNRWRLSAVGRNIFNKHYVTRIVTNQPGIVQQFPFEAFSSWGAALDVRF